MNLTKRKYIILICLLLVIAVAGGILFWFFAPGARRLGSYSRFNIQHTGYAIDLETMQVLGQTEVTVKGKGSVIEKKISDNAKKVDSEFSGTVDVADYRNNDPEYFGTSVDYDDGMFEIRYLENYFFVEDPQTHTGHAGQVTPFYTVYVIPERDDLVAVLVTDLEDKQTVIVCTDSPEKALEEYEWLKDLFGI